MICIILSLIAALIWTALIMFVTSFLALAYEVLSSTSADGQNRSYKDADTYNIGVTYYSVAFSIYLTTYHIMYIISKSTDLNYARAAPNSIKGPAQLAAEARKIRQAVFNVEEIEIYPHLAANHTKELHKPDTDPAELLWKQFRYVYIQPDVLFSLTSFLSVWLH